MPKTIVLILGKKKRKKKERDEVIEVGEKGL